VSFAPGAAEYEVVFTNNVIVTNNWVSLDIPISTFTTANPAMDFANLGQLLFINNNPGGPQFGTFFIDNVYFYSNAVPPVAIANYPTNVPPTPTHNAANVVSLYNSASNYTTVPIDTWLTGWSGASYSDYSVTNAGNSVVKRYSAQLRGHRVL